jgi:uncharacterized protein
VWHGGEPLLLPRTYFDSVLDLQQEVFGTAALASGRVRNAMQTNLYRPDFDLIQHLHRRGFSFGVSHDAVPGLRLAANGRDSTTEVATNLRKLHALGIDAGVIVVLSRYTAPNLTAIYRTLRTEVSALRFLPLAAENGASDMQRHAVPSNELAQSLASVCAEWLQDGCPIPIDPFDDCLRVLASHALGLEQQPVDRMRQGDSVIVVETSGVLRQGCELDDNCDALGDVRSQDWTQIRCSAGYANSLLRDQVVRNRVCGDCEFRKACAGLPALRFDLAAARDGRCVVYQPFLRLLQRELEELGIGRTELVTAFNELVVARHAA